MVVCKYFLQGTCKFGSYCHYEHDVTGDLKSYSNNRSSSILRQSNFGVSQNVNPPSNVQSNVDTATLVKSAANDMTLAEKGGQWLLSSYAPYKEKSAFPGFEDHSFEEIRFGFYEAKNNGTLDQYKQQLQALYHDTMRKVHTLQNPSQEVIRILQMIYNSPSTTTLGANIFSAFKPQPTVSSVSESIFSDLPRKNNQSIFLGAQQENYQGNIFASPQKNIFSTISKDSSFHRETNPTSNIFANVAPTTSNSVFADQSAGLVDISATIQQNSSSLFSSKTSSSIFGSQMQTNQPVASTVPVFPGQSVFASAITEQVQPFVSTNKNIFTQAQPQQSIFGASLVGVPSSTPLNDGSAKSAAFQTSSAAQGIIIDGSLYSKEEELTVDEKKWFVSNDMDILKIPEKPPAYSMCFRL